MPTERAEDLWVDEMDGPERLERAKKRRAEQLKRWERRENAAGSEAVETKRRRKDGKILKFEPNVVILEAAARNDLEEVARLLDSGASPDLANEDGLTALHQSCIDGCDDMVKYLVEHKANVNACDKESWTPLHAAAACGHMSIIRYLLDNGANILALNLDGNFPVDVAEDNEKVETFLEQQMAKLGYDEAAIEELRLNQGRQLLNDLKDSVKKERSLDVQDENGATAFHVAAANGWTNVIDYLLENEADFEIRDNDGWQPIHAAAAWGHDTILEVLVASGADLDSRTNDSQTPIDLTEEDEIIELIEDLKTKEVKYPRKGKGVRRRRSNTSNSSIKRSSIHEKNELSHADTKAERAALFIQLQNAENLELHSHDELASSPQPLETHVAETTSNSSREEANSSGYVSEGSTDAKAEEKLETNRPKEVSKPEKTQERPKDKLDIGDYIIEGDKKVMREKESTKNDEQKPSPAATKIKQSPVPKPPRMITTSSSKLEPNAYINLEIEPSESTDARTPANTTASKPASVAASVPAKELLEETKRNSKSENLRQSEDKSPKRNELNRSQEKVKTGAEEVSEKRTTQSLPRLASSDKRRAPEPPDSSQTASTLPVAKKSSATEDKKVNHPNEARNPLTKRAASSSSPSSHRNTAVTKPQPEQIDRDSTLASKTVGRGFSFPRSRKTCCLVM